VEQADYRPNWLLLAVKHGRNSTNRHDQQHCQQHAARPTVGLAAVQTDLCVDFSKAFDKVGHKRLVDKLKWYGVDGIREFLSGRSQCCSWWRVIQKCTCYILNATRIRPRTMPLSVLYQWYRPWFEVNGASFCRWHNDLLGTAVKSKQDADLLHKDLDKLVEWEKLWQMEFHPNKCEVISITRKKNPIKYPYTLHGQLLKHVDVVKYLGVKISWPALE